MAEQKSMKFNSAFVRNTQINEEGSFINNNYEQNLTPRKCDIRKVS